MFPYPFQIPHQTPQRFVDNTNDIGTNPESLLAYARQLKSLNASSLPDHPTTPKTWLVLQASSIPRTPDQLPALIPMLFSVDDRTYPFLSDRDFLNMEIKCFDMILGSLAQLAAFCGLQYDGPGTFTLALPHNTYDDRARIHIDQFFVNTATICVLKKFMFDRKRHLNHYGLLALLSCRENLPTYSSMSTDGHDGMTHNTSFSIAPS